MNGQFETPDTHMEPISPEEVDRRRRRTDLHDYMLVSIGMQDNITTPRDVMAPIPRGDDAQDVECAIQENITSRAEVDGDGEDHVARYIEVDLPLVELTEGDGYVLTAQGERELEDILERCENGELVLPHLENVLKNIRRINSPDDTQQISTSQLETDTL